MDRNIGTWAPRVAEKGGIIILKNTAKGITIARAVSKAVIASFFVFMTIPPEVQIINTRIADVYTFVNTPKILYWICVS
jgi:hypothetical protein